VLSPVRAKVDPLHWSRVQIQPGTQTIIGRGTVQRWTVSPLGNMMGYGPAPLRPLENMIGDGPTLYDRPRAAVTSSTRLQDRSVLLESADIRSDYILFGSYFKCSLPNTCLNNRHSCANVTVGLIFLVHFTVHCWNNRQSCTAYFLRNHFLAQAVTIWVSYRANPV
jgi:hypothetical protein